MVFGTTVKQSLLKMQGKIFSIQNLASNYDKISAYYTQNFNSDTQEYYYDLFKHLGQIDYKKILDLGCGTAWLGKVLFSKYSPLFYHGIDISSNMIYESRKNLREFSKIKFEHGDFNEILRQLPEESYDIVFLTWSLKFNKPSTLLEQVFRVLKTGGKLALLSETNDSAQEINSALQELTTKNNHSINLVLPKTYLPQDSHQLTELLNKTGFKQTLVWDKSRINKFASAYQLITWARQSGHLAAWDGIIDLENVQISEQLKTLIKPTASREYPINQKFLGAIARK